MNRILSQAAAGSDEAEPGKVAAWLQCERERRLSRQFGLKDVLMATGILCALLAVLHGVRHWDDLPRRWLLGTLFIAYLISPVAYPRIHRKWLFGIQAINAFGIVLEFAYLKQQLGEHGGSPVAFGAMIGFVAACFLVGRKADAPARPKPGLRGAAALEAALWRRTNRQ